MAESYYIHVLTTGKTRNPLGARAPADMRVAVGFGVAVVARDGRMVVDCEQRQSAKERRLFCDKEGFVTLRKVERYVVRRRLGRSKWQIQLNAPLWSATWERKGLDRWICVEAGEGFA